jgi:hypothetical protein
MLTSLPEAVWYCLKVAFRDTANEFRCRGNLSGLTTWVWALGRNPPSNSHDAPTFAGRAPGDTESRVFSQDYGSLLLPTPA